MGSKTPFSRDSLQDYYSNCHTLRLDRLLAQSLEALRVIVFSVERILVHTLLPGPVVVKVQSLVPMLSRVQVFRHGVTTGSSGLSLPTLLNSGESSGCSGTSLTGREK